MQPVWLCIHSVVQTLWVSHSQPKIWRKIPKNWQDHLLFGCVDCTTVFKYKYKNTLTLTQIPINVILFNARGNSSVIGYTHICQSATFLNIRSKYWHMQVKNVTRKANVSFRLKITPILKGTRKYMVILWVICYLFVVFLSVHCGANYWLRIIILKCQIQRAKYLVQYQ